MLTNVLCWSGLFLLDTQYAVYVWSGWWPTETKDEENVKTGSAEARFNIDRKCTLETAIHYCKGTSRVCVVIHWEKLCCFGVFCKEQEFVL